jgi:hypothetical protein
MTYMSGYRIISLIQAVIALFCALTILDFDGIIGLNIALAFTTGWWSVYAFWAYSLTLIAILQIVKAFIVKERN